MGTGDFICISMTGGAPWGFRLQGGKEQKQPLQVAKIRSQSKASGSGLCEGDEVVSINGNPCADLTYPEVIKLMESVTDSLQMLVKRPSSGISETVISETEHQNHEHLTQEGYVQSTTLQIRPAPPSQCRELYITPAHSRASLAEDQGSRPACSGNKKEEMGLSCHVDPHMPDSQRGCLAEEILLREKAEAGQLGPVIELQLSLSQERHQRPSVPVVALLGAEKSKPPAPDPDLQHDGIAHLNSIPAHEPEDPSLKSSKIIQLSRGTGLRVIQGSEAGDAGQPHVEVILDCSDRQKTEGCRLPAARGCVDSPVEGGQSEAPPSLVSFAVSSEGTEQGEDPRSERDHSRPHKHRARHARLRRSESLSEKQVKEAKSKCKSIALLLTDAPNPNSKGVLMFKKRRKRAKKYTLISYGTGELEREADEQEEEGDREDTSEAAFLGASESEVDEELLSDIDDTTQAVNFDWDSGLVDIEKKTNRGDKMEMLPDTTGKGALMFAKRRERMDQITAQKEEESVGGISGREPDAAHTDGLSTLTSYQRKEQESVSMQSSVNRSYMHMNQGLGHLPQQNGFSGMSETAEAQRMTPMNRTAKPFPGSVNQPAAPFSPTRSVTSPTADFPAPPPYSAVTPPPEAFSRAVPSPIAGPALPPPWPQPAPWSQPAFYDSSERIASRDERIAVPAKKTGILQEAKRRSTTKPMFTFKEPKVSPNPELLSLLQNSEGKRSTGAGGDSGPEEDYLSLGAEACNFMQSASAKQKTPPPVAPKPAIKSSSQPVTPVSPAWSPGVAPTQPPAFPTPTLSQGVVVSSIKVAQPSYPARPASVQNVAGPFKGPQVAVASQNYLPKPNPPATIVNTAHASAAGPSTELPGMSGRGAQLFAKRQSRMEKYVVDSETVQAHAARSQSPTPSLPASWKYSSNVRAPPPIAYNPIHSPSYPLAAIKSQPSAPQASKTSKKKGKKPLNALDVMKHQPYQLNASLFTFQPPDAKDSLPQKASVKVNSVPAMKQALPPRPVSAGSPITAQASSVYSVPAYSSQPAFYAEATSPVSASPVPAALSTPPKQESASTSYFVAPRPKFSAKKSGVTVQESGRSLSLPGRPVPPTFSTTSPWIFQPACNYSSQQTDGLEKANKRLTPWEAAAKSPLGLVDDAFKHRSIQESIVANVVSAARRKVLLGPPEDWNERLPYVPEAQKASVGSFGRREYNVASFPDNSMHTNFQYGSQFPYAYYRQPSRNDSEIMSLETRSDYCVPVASCNYNPHPRGWRRQT
ncbi:synaptopodin-2 isoform X2 [Talpa occidentalis]|uniref:synaptopodin-2 isoform X2 n=1 Tax=Talpa occidentalis TaxID=50954 RepID=UPI0023FA3E85|nr:synaptopodin-2 isoform X2 [Talpa occidentalis]